MSRTPLIHVRVGGLYRSGALTPYLTELILDDVRRHGRGGRVEIRLAVDADQASLDAVDARLAPVRRHGVLVVVCRRSRRARGAALSPEAAA